MLILAGDFNQLSNSDILSLGLSDCVYTPTHRGHNLDRVYCSGITYKHFKIVTSTVKTEHRAIVARSDDTVIADCNKVNRKLSIRKRSPQQHASLLSFMRNYSWQAILLSLNVQLATNDFYAVLQYLLDRFYPLSGITVTSRDPAFVTPKIK